MLQVAAAGIEKEEEEEEEEEEEDSIFVKASIQFLKLRTLISLYFPDFISFCLLHLHVLMFIINKYTS
jgi:hypothetical protein